MSNCSLSNTANYKLNNVDWHIFDIIHKLI